MVITSRHMNYRNSKGEIVIKGIDRQRCPVCRKRLFVHDTRRRKVKYLDGEVKIFRLRRLVCKHCHTLHTEIPSCIVPYKRYAAEVIESELTEDFSRVCPAEKSTVRRWKKAFCKITASLRYLKKRSPKYWLTRLYFLYADLTGT